jgi:hypothetical protein
MRDESGRGPSTSLAAVARVLLGIGLVLVAFALVLNLATWVQGGQLNRRGFLTSLGIGLLLSALFAGPQRRALFYALLVTSLALIPVSFFL